jgi:site-specific DNA recombinase
MRAAIYARFSSDRQDERSIEDQVRLCRELAERLGATVVDTYADFGISGAHLGSRPEALRLIADLRLGRFDLVLAEALDRISRDQEDTAHLWKRIVFAGAKLVTFGEGEISEMHVGFKGTMNAVFLKDLAQKVRRGQKGRVIAGKSAGGLAYGYRVVRALDASGEPIRGDRVIDPDQAQIVRRIFAEFVAGKSPRAIAADLNRDGIPAPMGGHLNASTINGHPSRGNGILANQAYIGRLVWNRVRMVKDPDTGKRLSRVNAGAERVAVDAPHLRIIEDELWRQATLKRQSRGIQPGRLRRPRHLLSGLLRCALCGGAYVSLGATVIGCSNHRERGTCDNGGGAKRAEIERRVLDGLRLKLLHPEAVRAAMQEYHAERMRLAHDRTKWRRELGRRLARMKTEIEQLVDRICDRTATAASDARLMALDGPGGERERLEQELAALEAADRVVDVHPGALAAYARAVDELAAALAAGDSGAAEAVSLIRRLVEKIEIHPAGRGRAPQLTLYGRLAELLSPPIRSARIGGTVVAGEGLEPPTLGL